MCYKHLLLLLFVSFPSCGTGPLAFAAEDETLVTDGESGVQPKVPVFAAPSPTDATPVPKIEGTTEIPPYTIARLKVTGVDPSAVAVWDAYRVGAEDQDVDCLTLGHTYAFTGPPAKYRVTCTYFVGGKGEKLVQIVTVRGAQPPPVVVVPDPVKTDPVKTDPQPVVVGKPLTVMVVYDTKSQILSTERDAFYAAAVHEYLKSHCAKRDGHPEWRILDDGPNLDVSEESAPLQKAYAKALAESGGKWPWIVIADGEAPLYSGEFPDTDEAVLQLLKKYGG
jgi:hypothetical protein